MDLMEQPCKHVRIGYLSFACDAADLPREMAFHKKLAARIGITVESVISDMTPPDCKGRKMRVSDNLRAEYDAILGGDALLTINEVAARRGVDPSTVSAHLRVLGWQHRIKKDRSGWAAVNHRISADTRARYMTATQGGKRNIDEVAEFIGVTRHSAIKYLRAHNLEYRLSEPIRRKRRRVMVG